MSLHFKRYGVPPIIEDFGDSMAKQSFKDDTDINKLLARGQVQAATSHLEAYGMQYGDFTGYDFQENLIKLTQGRELFDKLPSEVRSEFDQSPAAFFDFVNDPANVDRLGELLPALAQPGSFFPDVSPATEPGATLGDPALTQAPASDPEPSAEVSGSQAPDPDPG